jgi:hypothetical protein
MTDDRDTGKTFNGRRACSFRQTGPFLRTVVYHDACDAQPAGTQGHDGQKRMVDRAQPGARNNEYRQVQYPGQVQIMMARGQRDHDPACPFHQHTGVFPGKGTECRSDPSDLDHFPLALRCNCRRERISEPVGIYEVQRIIYSS